MKILQYEVVSVLTVLLAILTLITLASILCNKVILGSNSPKAIRLFIMAIAPPKDIYEFLINEGIDLSKENSIRKYELKNKYAGRHDVGVLLENFSDDQYFKPLSQRFILKLKMQVNFYLENKLILSRAVEDRYDPFLGRNGNGFSFITYECPQDLPLNKLIICEVKVMESDGMLNSNFGPVRFYVRKMSDK